MISFCVPARVKKSKNKYFNLNLNEYLNAHYRVLNNAKRDFDALVPVGLIKSQLKECPIQGRVRVHYTYFVQSARRYDRMNVLSIVDKFLMDTLVKSGILKDDDYTRVLTPTFEHGGVDKDNPRIEVRIEVV